MLYAVVIILIDGAAFIFSSAPFPIFYSIIKDNEFEFNNHVETCHIRLHYSTISMKTPINKCINPENQIVGMQNPEKIE